jgi:hypothetical protein
MFLIVDIVSTIGGHRVTCFMVVGHGKKGFDPSPILKGRWRMGVQPLQMYFTFMVFSVAEPVLSYKFLAKGCQPDVMNQGKAHPLGTGVIRMALLVPTLRGGAV